MKLFRRSLFVLLLLALVLASASSAFAQKDKKKKKDPALPEAPGNVIPLPDEQRIDYQISEMLGAWQVGDIEKLHKNIADDVTVVNGQWAPPVIGWTSYLASYQSQRARVQQVRLDRTNTLVRVSGNFAWACYQWDFSGVVDGTPSALQGQTTLIFEKRNGNWIIVHNHTSLVGGGSLPAKTAPQATPPAKP